LWFSVNLMEKSYDQSELESAVDAVKAGATPKSAALKFGVPRTTIIDHAQGTI
jgi:hypothetical protein